MLSLFLPTLFALIGWLTLTSHAAPLGNNNASLSSFAHNANPWKRTGNASLSSFAHNANPWKRTPFDPLRLPASCTGNVYCLSIQTANNAYTEWVHVDLGKWDFIEDTPGMTWRTFGFNRNAAGTIRMACHPNAQDDFHFSFGATNGWSYMGTQSRELRGHTSDGKTMSAVSAKAVVATKQPGVDLRVWCRNWGALEAERGEAE